jgi:hypothetical protein
MGKTSREAITANKMETELNTVYDEIAKIERYHVDFFARLTKAVRARLEDLTK